MSSTTVIGYVVGVPFTGSTRAGTNYANFRISEYVGRNQADGSNRRQIHPCVVFDQPLRHVYMASSLAEWTAAGHTFDDEQWIVTGDLRREEWTDEDGVTHRDTKIVVTSMGILQDYDYVNNRRPARPAHQPSDAQREMNARAVAAAKQVVATSLPDPDAATPVENGSGPTTRPTAPAADPAMAPAEPF